MVFSVNCQGKLYEEERGSIGLVGFRRKTKSNITLYSDSTKDEYNKASVAARGRSAEVYPRQGAGDKPPLYKDDNEII